MGICYWDAKTLWEARGRGAGFGTTLTVGRQSLNLHPREVSEFRRLHAAALPGAPRILRAYKFYDYADDFLRDALGARELDVMDYSAYEGATVIHDLNQPVPAALHERYDAVIDGGALEHIFNFPVAVSNLMNMTKPGGRVFLFLPANNLCGHGFYQFSPELMFRIFTERNGFETERILLWESSYPGVETTPAGVAYDVADPESVRGRVGLMSRGPVIMGVQARKIATVPLFATPPLQSDYSAIWQEAAAGAPAPAVRARGALAKAWRALPMGLRLRIKGILHRRDFSFANRVFYRPRRPNRAS